jgi:putative acetyltransferase
MTEITLRIESPRQAEVMRLIEALDVYQKGLYPPESNHFLDVEALAGPSVRFFVARRDGQALGCGALRIDLGWGELKRMFVSPEARGLKLGRRLLERLEEEARREGLGLLRLETGIHQPEAVGLYRSAGYVEREAFADYTPDPLSVFMEKRL